MSNPMDTEPPTGNASSSSASAPKKPSIRVLDQHPEALATREDDLANGPSLLGFGDGVGGHEYPTLYSAPQLGLELESEGLGHHHHYPVTRMLPDIPSGLPTASTLQVSESSASGPSMSVPTDSLSTSDDRAAGLFVRAYEFSWENSRLCFAGEPLNVVRATEDQYSKVDPDSRSAHSASPPKPQARPIEGNQFEPLAGIGSFDDTVMSWVASELPQDLETALQTCVVSDAGSSSDTMSEGDLDTSDSDPQRVLGYQQNIESLRDFLVEDFVRSYAPQRSRKLNNAARRRAAQHADGDPGAVTGTTSTPIKQNAGPRKRKAIGGSGDSDDEESRDDGQGTSVAKKPKSSRRFACPFLKWRPRVYSTCDKKLKEMSHVKHHLSTVHKESYCGECFRTFGPVEAGQDQVRPVQRPSDHPCRANSHAPLWLVTADKFKKIEMHGNSLGMKSEERWYLFFEVLFPKVKQPRSPYLDSLDERKLRHVEEYLCSKQTQRTFDEKAQKMDFGGEILLKIKKLVFKQVIPHAMEIYGPNREYSSDDESVNLAQDDDGEIDPHLNETLDFSPVSTISPADTNSCGLQSPGLAMAAQADLVPMLTGPSASIPGVPEAQPSNEGIANWEPPNTTETGYLELAGPDTFGPLADGEFSRLLWSEEHQLNETDLEPVGKLSFAF
ncbi:hypothetical protein FALBO_6884 [Fusarium albosuccineum]|uniref:C2H2-type domain-containing protein n=1 Tax=Fusarium albosuccineum TaxID=1237068 RepID=A0A8H4LEL0_9HYPO|nr:hypothetical protein FALBO_6884 [Fusarium albosuccineum]